MVRVVGDKDMSDESSAVTLARIEGKLDLMAERQSNANTRVDQLFASHDALTARVVHLENDRVGRKALSDMAKYIWGVSGVTLTAAIAIIIQYIPKP